MRQLSLVLVGMSLVVLSLAVSASAAEAKSAVEAQPAVAGAAAVTIKGVMMCEICCTRNLAKEAAEEAEKTLVLFAVEGTPEVTAALDGIMKEYYSGDSIDADQARKIQGEFEERLKYYITPGELTERKENGARWWNPAKAVTGVVSEKDGRKWITPSKITGTKLKYPDKMLAPDKPLVQPGKRPLILKVNDVLSLKCILLPAGKYFAGVPFYATYDCDKRYDDDYPAMLTLTKSFYLAEIPVTQEMYESVMGNNPSDQKGPQIPVHQVSCVDIQKFCRILSEKNGRKVRLPTQAEWEYAARVGTSNAPFVQKYKDQINVAPDGKAFLPVKSKQRNAWGLYDMIGCSWEIIGDRRQFSRNDMVDPHYPTPCEKHETTGKKHDHNAMGRNTFSFTTTREGVGDGSGTGYGLTRFRMVVEATPEEIAEMEKAANK
jgi:formylglycine-generating enzyme required for sulfatase activity